MVFAPQETRLAGTQVETVPLWQEQEGNREGFEVSRRKAKTLRASPSFLRRIATQQSVWHPVFDQENPNGKYAEGTYLGQEIASENTMVRKHIVGSLIYWAKEYAVYSFRFDQGRLIDQETMHEFLRELHKLEPGIKIITKEG